MSCQNNSGFFYVIHFTNMRYFTDVFKKEMNMTPLAYRKAIQNDMIL